MQEKPRHKFTTLRDHFRLAATTALAWAPTLYLLTPQVGMKAAFGLAAAAGAVSAGLCVPGIRNYFSDVYNRHYREKNGCLPAPPALAAIVEDVSRAAGYEQPPKAHIIPGEKINATMAGNEIYFTSHALFALDSDEQKFLAAHEISHHRGNDQASESMLALPRIYSLTMMAYSVFVFLDTISGGPRGSDAPSLHEALNITTTYSANLLWQTSLWLYLSRAHEYRADRNGALLSDRAKSGVSMLEKASPDCDDDVFSSLIATHPRPEDRIARLKKEAAGMNPPPP